MSNLVRTCIPSMSSDIATPIAPPTGCGFHPAPYATLFGLSLWTELKVANCTCASGWSCLMNLDLIHFWLSLVPFVRVDFVPAGKILVHRELEVPTVYQRFLTSWQRPINPRTFLVILQAYTRCVRSYRLQARIKFLNKS